MIINGVLGGDRRGRRLFGAPGRGVGARRDPRFPVRKGGRDGLSFASVDCRNAGADGAGFVDLDLASPEQRDLKDIGVGDALLMGLAQAFALVPGVSRSGATITVARFSGSIARTPPTSLF